MSMAKKEIVLSCIQPTGELHLGNYLGAVKNWVEIQDTYSCVYGIVDLHAMTMPYDPTQLKERTLQMAFDLLACGINPEKSLLFIQSLVPQHTELAWMFNCVCSYGELSKMTQFKDKSDFLKLNKKNSFVSAGLFTYPVLQAADILIYLANFVPVGKDQEQHLELTRNIAVRFNTQFGNYFPEPQPLFTETPKLMSLADPSKKMSKSLGEGHYIGLFESEEGIHQKIKLAVTDSGLAKNNSISAGIENLFTILKACGSSELAKALFEEINEGKLKYSDLKEATSYALINLTKNLKERREEIMQDKKGVEELIQDSSARARTITSKTIKALRELTGLPQITF